MCELQNHFYHSKMDLHRMTAILDILVHKESLIWSQWRQRHPHRLHDPEFLLITEPQPSGKVERNVLTTPGHERWLRSKRILRAQSQNTLLAKRRQKEINIGAFKWKKAKEKLKLIFHYTRHKCLAIEACAFKAIHSINPLLGQQNNRVCIKLRIWPTALSEW